VIKGGKTKVKVTGNKIDGLITFKGTMKLHGASSRHVSFSAFPGVTSPSSSCAKLAAHGNPVQGGQQPLFRIPAPAIGTSAYFSAEVSPYHGAGTYDKAAILTSGASITVGTKSYSLSASGATATVTFSANGSGTFTFSNAAAAKAGKPSLSGSVSWTCSA
jgi:hypothetical protein